MSANIVVVGSLNMDLVVRAPRMPAPGETLLGSDFHTIPGGKGANQAVAAARQGANVIMVGRVGHDSFGQSLLESLRREAIASQHVVTDWGISSGIAFIAIDSKGENHIIVVSGANGQLSPYDIDAAASAIANADVLIVQLEIPLAAVRRAIDIAKENNTTAILNAAPAQPLPIELLTDVDYLIVNESEAALLTGHDPSEPKAAGQALRSAGVCRVIVTLGEQGALLLEDTGITRIPSFPVSVVDTTAAGDAFVGAFAVALAEGKPIVEAVRWANASGALATTVLGAQPSLPTYAAVAQFLSQRETTILRKEVS